MAGWIALPERFIIIVFCSGSTALIHAVEQDDESMVQLLLEHGADVNAVVVDPVAKYGSFDMGALSATQRALASMRRLGQCQELDLAAPAEVSVFDIM